MKEICIIVLSNKTNQGCWWVEKKALRQRQMIPGPLLTEIFIFSRRGFGSLKTRIFAPAPILQVESTVTIIPHSHFCIELLAFSKWVPSHYYLNPYIITAVWKFRRDLPVTKGRLHGPEWFHLWSVNLRRIIDHQHIPLGLLASFLQ